MATLYGVKNDGVRRIITAAYGVGEFGHRELTLDEAETRDDWTIYSRSGKAERYWRTHKDKYGNVNWDGLLKHLYPEEAVVGLSLRSHPLLEMLRRD